MLRCNKFVPNGCKIDVLCESRELARKFRNELFIASSILRRKTKELHVYVGSVAYVATLAYLIYIASVRDK
jgi:hypothetical protein